MESVIKGTLRKVPNRLDVDFVECLSFLRRTSKNDLDRIADEPFNHNEYVKDLNEVFS